MALCGAVIKCGDILNTHNGLRLSWARVLFAICCIRTIHSLEVNNSVFHPKRIIWV